MNLPPLVLDVLVVIVVLIVLYLLARKVKPFGKSLGFVCAVGGRLLVTLSHHMERAALYCHNASIASLRYPPGVRDGDYWSGVNVLSRLVYFLLAVCILLGETANTLLVLPTLFNTTGTLQLPDIVEFASAALFICCPALCGAVILEVCGLIPQGAGLFPPLPKLTRWVLGILSAVVLVLAILVTGYFYLFRAAYLLDPASTQGMSLYILAGLGVETASVSVLALWACVVGGAGVVALLLFTLEKTCEAIGALASFVPELLDILALHLTDGTIGVYGKQIARDPHTYPSFSTAQQAVSGQQATSLLPQQAASFDAAQVEIVPIATPVLEETPIMKTDKNAFLGFVGEFGAHMFPHVVSAIDRLRATDSILCSYYLERSYPHVHTTIPGIRNLSHTPLEKNLSMLHGANEDEADHKLLCDLSHKIAESYRHLLALPSSFAYFIDCHDLVNSIDLLEANKKRLPLISQVVVTSVSQQDGQHKGVQTGLADCAALAQEGFLDGIVLVAPNAPFPLQHGVETLYRAAAQLFVSLIIAHKHHPTNPHFSSVFKQGSRLSPFLGMSFASLRVAAGSLPKRVAWIPGVKGQAGTGILSNILTESREAIDRVMTEEETCAFPSPLSINEAWSVLVNIPVAVNDVKFAPIARANSQYTGTHYPTASCSTVRGNGIPYPSHLNGRYMVSAFCLYPLQHTAAFAVLQGEKRVNVTPLNPVAPGSTAIEPTNGKNPLKRVEPVNKTTNKKVSRSASRSSNAASTSHRIGRKKVGEK